MPTELETRVSPSCSTFILPNTDATGNAGKLSNERDWDKYLYLRFKLYSGLNWQRR
ncbi:hypothetical protein DPMN_162067 [Dreissena polymorpha]|uniref:Uncharacterized protein n=1 Tax=Dreissena polymorpha TaxID=45954 RepID=A0A9D4IQ82_DREPO|nr:hypothetical protein DPMN_162067 [Dreissena polymorpha]